MSYMCMGYALCCTCWISTICPVGPVACLKPHIMYADITVNVPVSLLPLPHVTFLDAWVSVWNWELGEGPDSIKPCCLVGLPWLCSNDCNCYIVELVLKPKSTQPLPMLVYTSVTNIQVFGDILIPAGCIKTVLILIKLFSLCARPMIR